MCLLFSLVPASVFTTLSYFVWFAAGNAQGNRQQWGNYLAVWLLIVALGFVALWGLCDPCRVVSHGAHVPGGGRGLGFEAGAGVVGHPGPPEVDHVGHGAELLASQLAFHSFAGQARPAGAGLPVAQGDFFAAAGQ